MRIRRFLLLPLVCMAALAQAPQRGPRQPASWLDPDRTEPAGTHYRTFTSKLAASEVSYLIYFPPDYETAAQRRYPVVYWLHGLNGNQQAGAKFVAELDSAIHKEKAPAMIVVLVNGMRDSFYNDSPDGKWPIESVIMKELIPHIDKTCRTDARREARGVEGYSMGGFGAAHLGFKYPETFGMVGIMAGALIQYIPDGPNVGAVMKKMFGSEAYFQENHPFTLVKKNADAIRGRTAVRIGVGGDDGLQKQNKELHELLTELKIEHEFEIVPGVAHAGTLFYQTLGERAFAWYQKALGSRSASRTAAPQSTDRPAAAARAGDRPVPSRIPNASAPSHVIKRGDLEILTFETEQNYDRLQELYQQSQQTKLEPEVMAPRYLQSRTDGSVQPYAVRLPHGYDATRKYPLVIQLHGLNFKEVLLNSRLNYRGMNGPQWIHPDLPVIYAQCFGRPSTFYQGMGEEDVLEVMEDVKRTLPIDPDRVFIMGHSMGGAGSYTVGLHYPDLFGGIMPLDPALWNRPDDAPKWMEPQMSIVSVPKLYPNARNVDVFFKNAGAGIQKNSTEFSDGIVAQGGFSTMESFPGMPHNFGDQHPYSNFVTEVIQHPVRRKPAEVKFYTNTLRYNHAYWVTIDRLTRHNADATVTAALADGSIKISTTNIDALTLTLGKMSAKLTVDGGEVSSGALPDVVHLSKAGGGWKLGEWPSTGLVKRHGLQGPIGDALNSKFLAVYGEGDRDLAIAELDAVRNPPGPMDIHGDFPMKAASRVTREDVASSNLILFGTPESNAVLKRIASSLPADLVKSGAMFIYPNPESPAHYVLVWTGKLLSLPDAGLGYPGWIMPLNLLPDYVQMKDGKIVSGGHFDNEWNR